MQSEERKVYRSKDGKLHETVEDAATSNLGDAVVEAVVKNGCMWPAAKASGVPDGLMVTIQKSECVVLHHWITKHPAELEAMIKGYLDDMATEVMGKVKP
jgi:hypothetical protein